MTLPSGDTARARTAPAGRNAACACGSGVKFKHCCARRAALPLHADLDRLRARAREALAARNPAEAVGVLLTLVGRAPHDAGLRVELANALRAQGRAGEAVEHVAYAVAIVPGDRALQAHLGAALFDAGRTAEAIDVLEGVAHRQGALATAALQLLATAYGVMGRHDDAVAAFRALLEARPDDAGLLNNLALALGGLGRTDEALALLRRAVQLEPGAARPLGNLAAAYVNLGMAAEAVEAYDRLMRLESGNLVEMSNRLLSLNYVENLPPAQCLREHRAFGELLARRCRRLQPRHDNERRVDRPLRIGYVSSDLRQHPVASFLRPVLRAHDRRAFVIHAYSDCLVADEVTAALKAHVAVWADVALLTDEALAQRIQADRIDILIDLNGHAGRNRLGVFARRPAPVQVTWLGYVNTTGLAAIDYRLTDALADPPGPADAWCVERLIRLPAGFLCFEADPAAPAVAPIPSRGCGSVTFGSFNHRAKVGPAVIAAWSRVLQASPGASLLLKGTGFGTTPDHARVHAAFAAHGIDPARIRMLGRDASTSAHLSRYGAVDVALDTFPYAGTTTTCEALWMGVPVVTLAGAVHATRVGASILARVGLDALVTTSTDAFVQCAARVAADAAWRTELRTTLRERMRASPLMDGPAFTRQLEDALRAMWRTWSAQGLRA